MKHLRQLILLLIVCACGTASAAITSGYYRIKSYNDKFLTEDIIYHTLVCSDLASTTQYAQVWYLSVSGSNVSLKNALTGRYVQKTTGNSWSEQYLTGTSSNTFTLSDEGSGIFTFTDKWNAGPHCDAGLNVVLWMTSETKSKWTIESVTVNQTELNAVKASLEEATTAQLQAVFTDLSCSALKNGYTTSAVNALPATTQALVTKIKNNSWTTYSGWDKTEKTFRVADYKPYSSHIRWTNILSKGHSMGRLSNPTGIWVGSGDVIQVYVGTIPSGQSVALEVAGYGQSSGTQYTLHSGMNSLLMASSGNCFIFYEVDNTNGGNAPYASLSNYADVTVHIEGGTVQGYFDLTKGYTDADWTKMKSLLLTDIGNRPSVCLKTDKHVMNLGIDRLISALDGSSITEMLNVWKNLAAWEDELCGRSDSYGGQTTYGQYCNSLYTVTALPGTNGSPHATNYGTYYYEYSDPKIFNAEQLLTVADNMWCIAHEQGHNRQTPINMVGNTEMSNNVFSNMAIYKQGHFTSRTDNIKAVFCDYIDGISWPERVQRANNGVGDYNAHILHLNWSLYLFFHINGNDPDFFPRLFDALRADPMTKVSGSGTLTPASTDYLKYYVKCCEVSGYDLTDFFASYGFFMLPPEQATSITYNGVTTNLYQSFNDYADYNLYVTQEMIDAAKAQVKAMNNLKSGSGIVFIEDRVTAPIATYEGHAEGELRVVNPDAPVKAFGDVGEMGQYTDFDAECSAYRFNVEGKYVKTEGSGAVGFILYDKDGNIAGFYNTKTFSLPDGIEQGYTIMATAGDGTLAEVAMDPNIEVVPYEFPRTDVWYSFRSILRGNRYILSNGSGEKVVGATAAKPSEAMQWRIVPRQGDFGNYDIVNRSDGSYLSPLSEHNKQIETSTTQPSVGWKFTQADTKGLYVVYCPSSSAIGTALNQTNNTDYPIYNWGAWYGTLETNDLGCQYLIEAVDPIEASPLSDAAIEILSGKKICVGAEAATDLETNRWYVMYDRGNYRAYLYENATSHTLYNTLSAPSGSATDACRYLVRLFDAGSGKYYLQTGYGNYFGSIEQDEAVNVTSVNLRSITVAKIADTDGHFYLQAGDGHILDANYVTAATDGTVVGYGTTVPSSINGNNDWAFYPVTLYLPGDVNLDGSVTIADVTALVNIILGMTTSQLDVADVNGDGSVTIADVTALVNIILGR